MDASWNVLTGVTLLCGARVVHGISDDFLDALSDFFDGTVDGTGSGIFVTATAE